MSSLTGAPGARGSGEQGRGRSEPSAGRGAGLVTGRPILTPAAVRAGGLLAQFRALVRGSELLLVLVCGLIGCMAGACVALYGISLDQRLSAAARVSPLAALVVPVAGGLALGLSEAWRRWRNARTPVDPVEANALRGGRMSLRDSVLVAAQTVLSNGCGASVGLEAGYTQIGAGLASRVGIMLNLRRSDLRIVVGAGAAGAIAAAFGAPLTGAFYAFELIVGVYSVANVAAIMAASLAAVLTAQAFSGSPYSLHAAPVAPLHTVHYLAIVMLGLIASFLGVAVMRTTAVVERVFAWTRAPPAVRPAMGGLIVGALALVTPQVLAAGHGALRLDWPLDLSMKTLVLLIALKLAASMISLGSGFRGGLFFASLFIGSLLGKLYGVALARLMPDFGLDVTACMLAGMGTTAVAIVGGPLTMSFLVLETTADFGLTGAVLAACVAASLTVREIFGYSFSTWRLHLRGETIRSAADVGWIRSLTVGRLMRKDVATLEASATIAEFRRRYPLGSRNVVVLLDPEGRYAGLVTNAEAFAAELDADAADRHVADLARLGDIALLPDMNVKEAMDGFGKAESETLAVVDAPETRRIVGLLNEAYATRRYAEALNNASRDVVGGF
jgi:CIC family chloride channel protein